VTALPAIVVLFAAGTADSHTRAIRHFGGTVVKASSYPNSETGFARYLRDSGVRRITAGQLTAPNHPEIAGKYGYKTFLPRQEWWSRGAVLALIAERIQQRIGYAVRIRNWWRPNPYNADQVVGGSRRSDHLTADAVDIDYPSIAACRRAGAWLRLVARTHPWLRLSLGTGPTVTHVGFDSPIGSREWRYE
jgi:hypothetical protein